MIPYRQCGCIKLLKRVFSVAKVKQFDTIQKAKLFRSFAMSMSGARFSREFIINNQANEFGLIFPT